MSHVGDAALVLRATVPWLLVWFTWSLGTFFLLEAGPPSLRRRLLLVSSAGYALVEWPIAPVILLAVAGVTVWALQSLPRRLDRYRTPLLLLFLLGVYLPVLLSGRPFQWMGSRAELGDRAVVLGAVFTWKRALSFTWERHVGRVGRSPLGDVLLHLFALPFLLSRGVIPSFSHFFAQERTTEPLARVLDFGRTMLPVLGHGVALVGGTLLVRSSWDIRTEGLVTLVGEPSGVVGLVLVLHSWAWYARRYVFEQTTVAMCRLFGYRIDDNYDHALLATGYADFWRRWNVHLREFVVAAAYYPVALALVRRFPGHRALAVVGACTATFFVHWVLNSVQLLSLVNPARVETRLAILRALAVYEVAQIVLVAGSLLLGNPLRARLPRLAPAVGVVTTTLLRAGLVVLVVWRGDGAALLLKLLAWPVL